MAQTFVSLYLHKKDGSNKTITIAFNKEEVNIYNILKPLSSEEIRELLKINFYEDIEKLANKEKRNISQYIKIKLSDIVSNIDSKEVNFINSKKVPFQRWFPYLEGYGVDFVKYIFNKYGKENYKTIYEPFAGTGTTLFGASDLGLNSYYSEINPLLYYIIDKKKKALSLDLNSRKELSVELKNIIRKLNTKFLEKYKINSLLDESYKNTFEKSIYFTDENYNLLLKARTFNDILLGENRLLGELFTIGIIGTMIPCSLLKRSGDLRFKTKKELENSDLNFIKILIEKLNDINIDLLNDKHSLNGNHQYIIPNAKNIGKVNIEDSVDMVITSPPYLNGTNYFRNTKLELWYLGYLKSKDDLRLFRNDILTSGINDVICINDESDFILEYSNILKETYKDLLTNSYDKRIPLMAKHYFAENYNLYKDLRKQLKDGSRVAIDIGDSIFADIHIKVDLIYIEILEKLGYNLVNKELLRKRRSRNGQVLSQILLIFEYSKQVIEKENIKFHWNKEWEKFKKDIPYQNGDFKKRNWGHQNHSLCSYQGKLKPAIAYSLIKTFVPKGGKILDPFSGVGTIPFEAGLNGIKSYGFDLSDLAYYVSQGKVSKCHKAKVKSILNKLDNYIKKGKINPNEIKKASEFGFNKKIIDYYEENTFKEILLAREFFKNNKPKTNEEKLVISCLLHILHGNRPYALSRKSHPIIPYAPSGEFEYKNLIEKLTEKLEKSINNELPSGFIDGKIFHMDSTDIWPQEVRDLDAIITSPPFFDSTRFYLANWIRLWFTGWENDDFKIIPKRFVDERQKIDFSVYDSIFLQGKERLKEGGVFILHLGKSNKCDMADELIKYSSKWFKKVDLFTENVEHCESHGIKDKGTVVAHQFLILS